MTKITIEQLTDVYQITCGDYKAIIHGNSNLQKEIESLFGNTDSSQKGQDTPRDPPGSYHKKDKKLAVPVAKPGVTKSKVHDLLDEGLTTAEIAVRLKLTEAAIIYHEKSYVQKDVQNEIIDPDKSINADETPDEVPIKEPEEEIQNAIPDPTPQETEPAEMVEFNELKISLPKYMLMKLYGDRKNTDKPNLTYYSNEGGGLIIQYGSNKCYTTWDDMHKLPHPIPGEMLTKLNSQKMLGVKAFKSWMVRQAEMSKTDDPDADFKPLISNYQNTHTDYDSKLDGVD